MNSGGEYKIPIIRRNTLITFLKTKKTKGKMLDIGCQTGETCYMLHKECFEVYGLDIDDKRITKAKEAYPQIEFKCSDCEKEIPFQNEFFDIV